MAETPQSSNVGGPTEKKPARDQYVIVTVIAVIVILLVIIPAWRFIVGVMQFGHAGGPNLQVADDGFIKARQSVNPEELRQWALTEMSQRPPKVGLDGTNIPMAEIPSNIYYLYPVPPGEVTAFNDKGQPYICFAWGAGLFHWMIVVGQTNYAEPTGVWTDYTTARWTNGIYYSREDIAHPIP